MREEAPTPEEMRQIDIDAAADGHTPDIGRMPVSTCKAMLEGFYGECDGQLEVLGVSPGYDDYAWVFLRCKKCMREKAYPNPIRRPAASAQSSAPTWQKRKDLQ